MNKNEIALQNCNYLDTFNDLPDACIDLFLEDMPYGTTNMEWDKHQPDLAKYWESRNRIAKPNTVFVLFCNEPFTSFLMMSNIDNFRQKLTWDKKVGGGYLNAHKMFMSRTEDVLVFSNAKNGKYTFNPIKTVKLKSKVRKPVFRNADKTEKRIYGAHGKKNAKDYDYLASFPTNLLEFHAFTKETAFANRKHPTQKPLDLIRYLVKTYSNENDLICDGFSGSGTTAHACIMEKRRFIGSELDAEYYTFAVKRIENAQSQIYAF